MHHRLRALDTGDHANSLSGHGRATLIQLGRTVWRSGSGISIERRKGYVIDDCVASGGAWEPRDGVNPERIVLPGSLMSGGYERRFAPLLALAD